MIGIMITKEDCRLLYNIYSQIETTDAIISDLEKMVAKFQTLWIVTIKRMGAYIFAYLILRKESSNVVAQRFTKFATMQLCWC